MEDIKSLDFCLSQIGRFHYCDWTCTEILTSFFFHFRIGLCHQRYQHEFDPTLGGSGRQEGLGVLWSMGSRRVGHDLMTKQQHSFCPLSSLVSF